MVITLAIIGVGVVWYTSELIKAKRRRERFGNTEFELATVNEKFALVEGTRKKLNDMEQLLTDIDTSCADHVKAVRLSWLGDDDNMHEYDLYLNGNNTSTECMRDIVEREIFELRGTISWQIAELEKAATGWKYCAQNDAVRGADAK